MKNVFLFVLSLLFIGGLEAKDLLKIEFAPAYLHTDLFENAETVGQFDMAAARADICCVTENGHYRRVTTTVGEHHHCHFQNLSFSLGRSFSIGEKIFATAHTGFGYVKIDSIVLVDNPLLGVILARDIFEGPALHIGVEATYNFKPDWRISASVQYAWIRDWTEIRNKSLPRRHSEGFAFAAQIEYDITKNWSFNLGGGVNDSFGRDKNGIRISCVKLGLARWY